MSGIHSNFVLGKCMLLLLGLVDIKKVLINKGCGSRILKDFLGKNQIFYLV